MNRGRLSNLPEHTVCSSPETSFRTEVILYAAGFYATIGCHPTRSKQFDKYKGGPSAYLDALDTLIGEHLRGKGRVVAVGECGLGTTFELFPSPDPDCCNKTTIGRTLPIQKHRGSIFVSLSDGLSIFIFEVNTQQVLNWAWQRSITFLFSYIHEQHTQILLKSCVTKASGTMAAGPLVGKAA